MPMKRKFESGAWKRKRQSEKEEYANRQRNSLNKYIISSEKRSKIENEPERTVKRADAECAFEEVDEQAKLECEPEKSDGRAETEFETIGTGGERAEYEIEISTTCDINVINNESNSEEEYKQQDKLSADCGKYKDDCVFSNDIALWPPNLSDKMIRYYLINKPCSIGDITTLKVKYEDRNRSYYRNVCESNFYCVKANGTKEFRQWLIYSETNQCIYCYVCRLFSNTQTKFSTGFNDWKNLIRSLRSHETSQGHMKSMLTLQKRLSISERIDTHLEQQIDSEQKYWRAVLQRVIATVKLLASLGVAFRGHRENTDFNRKGNFLSCIEYLAEFDSFLKIHLEKFGNPGSGKVNYLSHTVCDEFIGLMGSEVKKYLISEVQEAVYYSIIVDSTPDVAHVDQLTCILRFVDKNGNIKERFFGFINIENHNSEYLEQIILEFLRDLSIDIKNCRGQTYDNAANMAGKYSGLQARIKHHVNTATYVPCASHTLNLIGNCAAESCSGALNYFDFIQNLYVYFSASTRRWNILINSMTAQSPHIKRISDTRWASRADAVYALKCNYQNIKEALVQISTSDIEKPMSKLEAKKLAQCFSDYETALLSVLWNQLLERINSTSKSLQDTQYNLLIGTNLLKSLSSFIMTVRNNFEDIENSANLLTENRNYREKRIKKRKLQFEETSLNETHFNAKENFVINVHNVICDVLVSELSRRSAIYGEVLKDFGLFFNFKMPEAQFNDCVESICTKYQSDIDIKNFKDELVQFIAYVKEENVTNPVDMYKLVIGGLQSTFPNVETILKIFLTIPISNASGERSFSVLKRVKNYLRNSLSQLRLSDLSMMFIENDIVMLLDYESLIDKFSKAKARKVPL